MISRKVDDICPDWQDSWFPFGGTRPWFRFTALPNFGVLLVKLYPPTDWHGGDNIHQFWNQRITLASTSPNFIQAVGIKDALAPNQQGFGIGSGDALAGGFRQEAKLALQ